MKGRSRSGSSRIISKHNNHNGGGGSGSSSITQTLVRMTDDKEERKRLVPPTHTNRPYLDHSVLGPSRASRRSHQPMYTSDNNNNIIGSKSSFNYSRVGLGVVFRDADSSARALAELSQKKQERLERKRAGVLLGLLIFTAATVHVLTRPSPQVIVPTRPTGSGNKGNRDVDYGDSQGGDRMKGDDEEYFSSAGAAGASPAAMMMGTNGTRKETILDHFANTITDHSDTMTPFFFHVPRSGGQTIKDIVGLCLGKVQASDVGVREGHASDTSLQEVVVEEARYVNVDTTTKKGIERAAMMGFALQEPRMAEMVTSSYFLNSAKLLFTTEQPGRAFVWMRHPVERAVSMFHYKKAIGVLDAKVSLEEYGQGNGIENNWMVRFLTNAMEGELKKSHLDQAKKILSKKFLVLFLDDAEESAKRMLKYNGWTYDTTDETKALVQQDCVQHKLTEKTNMNPNGEYELPGKGSQAHALIAWQTQFDTKLYEFARQLFDLQTKQWGSKERKKEWKKKNKNKKAAAAGASSSGGGGSSTSSTR